MSYNKRSADALESAGFSSRKFSLRTVEIANNAALKSGNHLQVLYALLAYPEHFCTQEVLDFVQENFSKPLRTKVRVRFVDEMVWRKRELVDLSVVVGGDTPNVNPSPNMGWFVRNLDV